MEIVSKVGQPYKWSVKCFRWSQTHKRVICHYCGSHGKQPVAH